jgi:hypothetical protein
MTFRLQRRGQAPQSHQPALSLQATSLLRQQAIQARRSLCATALDGRVAASHIHANSTSWIADLEIQPPTANGNGEHGAAKSAAKVIG